MAIAAGIKPHRHEATATPSCPQLFHTCSPSWFTGIAFAAIGIGALVPAAIMSIAAANLFTRNIYKEYLKPDATPPRRPGQQDRLAGRQGRCGAGDPGLNPQFSIDLQLIGGVIILQTLPSVALGLYTRWFHRGGLIAGWVAGMGAGMLLLYNIGNPVTGKLHFAGSAFPLEKLGLDTKMTIYAGVLALAVNLAVAALGTVIARATKTAEGVDTTRPDHYLADEGDPRIKDLDLAAPGTHGTDPAPSPKP